MMGKSVGNRIKEGKIPKTYVYRSDLIPLTQDAKYLINGKWSDE